MSYGYGNYRNNGVRSIISYEEAVRKFENTEPIRKIKDGRNGGRVPLGYRARAYEFNMTRDNKGRPNDTIWCNLWGEERVVGFCKDGTVTIRNPRYLTTSTANFLGDLIGRRGGVQAYVFDFRLVVEVKGVFGRLENGMAGRAVIRQALRTGESMKMRAVSATDGGSGWEIINPKPMVTHVIDRKKFKEVRDKYSGLYEYIQQYMKLVGEIEMSRGDAPCKTFTTRGSYWVSPVEFKADADKLKRLLQGNNRVSLEPRVRAYSEALRQIASEKAPWGRGRVTGSEEDIKALHKILDRAVMGFHRDEVLVAKDNPDATRRDRYGYLWRRGWRAYHAKHSKT